jgi:hypothetical protein
LLRTVKFGQVSSSQFVVRGSRFAPEGSKRKALPDC